MARTKKTASTRVRKPKDPIVTERAEVELEPEAELEVGPAEEEDDLPVLVGPEDEPEEDFTLQTLAMTIATELASTPTPLQMAEATVEPAVVATKRSGHKWTQEEKDAMAGKMRAHWAVHEHPMKGKQLSATAIANIKRVRSEQVAIGRCETCNRPLYTAESVARHKGGICAAKVSADEE